MRKRLLSIVLVAVPFLAGGGVVLGPVPAAVAQTAPARPDEEAVKRAVGKIIVATVANAVGQKEPENLGQVIACQLALKLRDEAILSAVQDVFPQLSTRDARGVRRVICLALDGQLDLDNLDRQAAKEELVEQLRQVDPDLGGAAEVADFVYRVHQANRARQR